MIRRVDRLQAVQCTICERFYEIPRSLLRDPDGLMDFIKRKQQEHKDCKPPRQISKMVH